MNIKQFTSLLFISLIILMAIFSYFSYNLYSKQNIIEKNLSEIVKLNKSILNLQILSSENIFLHSATHSPSSWHLTHKEISNNIKVLKSINKTNDVKYEILKLETINNTILILFNDYLKIKKDTYLTKQYLEVKASHLYSLIIQINKMIFNIKSNQLSRLKDIHSDIKYQLIISVFIIILFLLISSYYMLKKIIHPINLLYSHLLNNKSFVNIELFDYKVNNEIDLITDTINDSIINTKKTIQELEEKNTQLLILNQEIEKKTQENFNQFQILQHQSKLVSMGEMISAIAHQWRQPLNVINGILYNLADAYEQDDLSKEYFDEMLNLSHQNLQHMSITIDNFRDFLKPSKIVDFKFDEIVASLNSIILEQLNSKGIKLRFEVEDNIVFHGSISDLEHVILNLINNAKDAIIESNRTNGEIFVKVEKQNKNISISVSNNGIEIDKNIKDRIFEPYFTTKTEDKGTGIGLYITTLIIEKSFSGQIKLEKSDDKKTIFRIII